MKHHFLKRAGGRGLFAAALFMLAANVAFADQQSVAIADRFPGAQFETTTPEAAGWSAEKIAEAKAWSQQVAPTAAVMIVQHGKIVAQWGDTAIKSNVHSIRKSLLSALIGIAVDEHKIDLGASMENLGIDDNQPSLTAEEKTATVADLLKARSGIYHAALYETPAMAKRRPPRGSHAPGTFWYYNNWDFNALGTIYEHVTGSRIFTAFQSRIAAPIGMQDYEPGDGQYFAGSASDHPAYPIRMSARDLARFALLYLHDGRWQDRQVVPSAWVHESTQAYSRAFSELGSGLGYGYLWWTGFLSEMDDAPIVKVPSNTYEAMGAEGQFAFVIPAYDLVVVHRVNSDVPLVPLGPRKPEPTFAEVGRLLWLILSAAGDDDVGPDAGLAHAAGTRLEGEALKSALFGKTLSFGTLRPRGPYVWQLHDDGTFTVLVGAERRKARTGKWRLEGGRYCRSFDNDVNGRELCFVVVANGNALQFFDADGLMRLDMKAD